MSESDKKGGGGLDDFDWDAALAEWDKKPFEPEVAAEKKEAPAPAAKVEEKPLYRAPMKTVDPTGAQLADLPKAPPPPPAPPTAAAKPPPPRPIPKPAVPLPQIGLGRKRGGLGQLFSKPDIRKPTAEEENDAIDVLLDEPAARKRFRAEDDEEGVVTSAVDVETGLSEIEDLPHVGSSDPEIGDGEMFDPFSEPPAKAKDAPTVHPPFPRPTRCKVLCR